MSKLLNSKYIISKKLGEGATSDVFLTTDLYDPNKRYAVKLLKGSKDTSEKLFAQEYQMLKTINHPSIISLIEGGSNGTITDSLNESVDNYYYLFELAEKGDLLDFVLYPQKGFSEAQARHIFIEILSGLRACHEGGIAHNDIKPENIMLDSNFRLKLADFGFSESLTGKNQDGLLTSFKGTPGYQSPEIIRRIPYDGIKSDLFSLGIVLFVLIYAKTPFALAKQWDINYQHIMNGKYDSFWKITKIKTKQDYSIELKDLLNKMFAYDPKDRITFEEIRKHPWINNNQSASYEEIKREFEERYSIIESEKNKVFDLIK